MSWLPILCHGATNSYIHTEHFTQSISVELKCKFSEYKNEF